MDGITAVVTGGTRGVGRAVASAFGDAGAHVVVCSRDGDAVDETVDALSRSASGLRADVRDEFDLERLMEHADRAGEREGIDVVVANAGVTHGAPGEMPLDGESYSRFDDTLRTNVRGVFATVREAVPYLADDARILVPSGSIARDAKPGMGAYAVSKAGAEAVVRQAHADLDATAMTLDPGLVDTALTGNQDGRKPEDVAPMFVWAATEADADEHGGAVVGLREWKSATR
ncbi:SDR family NAD(P)-dependent oxidoreductase [Halobaculum magnesiiphilum]|uniref:SDR family oxidoreductase n=1 Tax=Halobaculum magnesiiphilum TaxID=1017351 RepID=A0A8T8WCG1_9EURY|nr:SDR family oxidoreductase [Halobaculum magnesiiphilum]QZP37443.1 SDR family oxidoreductase [Halobaculum magnesiiphilum]